MEIKRYIASVWLESSTSQQDQTGGITFEKRLNGDAMSYFISIITM